jgi:competence protein ComEC
VLAGASDVPTAATELPPPGLRVTFLDVGQGDAILLDPRAGEPILVDAGPADAEVAERLDQLGVDRLAALVITHPQSDHAGGAPSVLERLEVGRLLQATADPTARAAARAAGTPLARLAAGASVNAEGRLRIEVLWPPREALGAARRGEDPNRLSLVLLARWRGLEILLSGDAEAELAPVDPGPVDVIKVAHHGSADAGLPALLARTTPKLAVISVGDANPYGHPAPQTLAELDAADVPLTRTDRDGEVVIEVRGRRWTVR